MALSLVTKAFGTANDRYLKRLKKNVDAINAIEHELEALDDAGLRARTDTFRQRLANVARDSGDHDGMRRGVCEHIG